MKITYIHHSGVSVETEQAVLLFDYFKGQLPAWDEKKPLFVFASHFHEDHYSPVIFELLEDREDVHYILSKDIRGRRIPPRAEGKIRFVKPGEVFASAADREGITLRVQTYKSTDEGVAFWVTADGQEIYHAGDLNNWWWEGEDKAWNHNMAANYAKEMDKMAGRMADAAFIPLDPRLEQWFYLGMKEFMEKADAKAVIPMHFWKDYSIIEKMRQHPSSEGWRERLIEIHREGEELDI